MTRAKPVAKVEGVKIRQEQSMQLIHLWGTERTSSFYEHVLQTPFCQYNDAKTPWKELWLKDLTSVSFAEETGATYISGFDDHDIITGNTSLFSEIEDQHPEAFDVVFVPVGGGGLLAACLQYFQNQEKRVKIVGVELESAPAMSLSLAHGRRVILEQVVGRAEGLLVRQGFNRFV
jgi:hypothetical protein